MTKLSSPSSKYPDSYVGLRFGLFAPRPQLSNAVLHCAMVFLPVSISKLMMDSVLLEVSVRLFRFF